MGPLGFPDTNVRIYPRGGRSYRRAWAAADCWWRPRTARPLGGPARSSCARRVRIPRRTPVSCPGRWALWSRATTGPRAGCAGAGPVAGTLSTSCTGNRGASWTGTARIPSGSRCSRPVSRSPFPRRLAETRRLQNAETTYQQNRRVPQTASDSMKVIREKILHRIDVNGRGTGNSTEIQGNPLLLLWPRA